MEIERRERGEIYVYTVIHSLAKKDFQDFLSTTPTKKKIPVPTEPTERQDTAHTQQRERRGARCQQYVVSCQLLVGVDRRLLRSA